MTARVGEGPQHLRCADWVVAPIADHATAVRYVRCWHYSRSAPNTSTYRHGLYPAERGCLTGDPLGVALWIPPTKNAAMSVAGNAWQGVLALSRFVIAPDLPTNAASFLLGRSMRQIDRTRWPVLLTYADTGQGHTGAIYKATNWQEVGAVAAGDTWVGPTGEQRGRKRGGFTYTHDEMRAMGFRRRAPLPKIKFVHMTHFGGPTDG